MEQLLSLPYHPQQTEGYCLPACVQMVLAYFGIKRSQNEIAHQLGMRTEIGVPASYIVRLQSSELTATYYQGTLAQVAKNLAWGIPTICFIQAGELSYWQGYYFQHAVIIVGLKGNEIYLLDPDAEPNPIIVSHEEFLLAWSEMDYFCATINSLINNK